MANGKANSEKLYKVNG